ncbi:MAG: mannonate dehydratase [Oscillospiraceae bacterium]|nr:mannonate dehydratase [Oscillospiraceae bacterium]
MKMTFRWYGENNDSVSLSQIRQIPNVTGVVGALFDVPVGEAWEENDIINLKNTVNNAGLELEVIESVNVHEDIKLGLPSRDKYIENYKTTIRRLSKHGIKVICYNFMPVFDWLRTDLAYPLKDGSNALCYIDSVAKSVDPVDLVKNIDDTSNGFSLPGWEPYRLAELEKLMAAYRSITEENLFENLEYFLKKIIPTCEECDVKMAIHPDDPPWSIYGLPRIVTCRKNIERMLSSVDSVYNGLTLCSGSLGANRENNIPELIRAFSERIHFAHVRNIKFFGDKDFHESSHLSKDGSLDLYEIMKAYCDIGFDGYIRPDHGRVIWGEKARPGYGLYDRALGIAYINGLLEAIEKENR